MAEHITKVINGHKKIINNLSSLDDLSKLGSDVRISTADFSAKPYRYAAIAIVTYEPIVKGLAEFVNEKLDLKNGYRATFVAIQEHDLEDGRFRYIGEIIPNPDVKGEEACLEATNRFLQSLPNIISSFRQHNPSKRRRR
jgi:hypothetical protein